MKFENIGGDWEREELGIEMVDFVAVTGKDKQTAAVSPPVVVEASLLEWQTVHVAMRVGAGVWMKL